MGANKLQPTRSKLGAMQTFLFRGDAATLDNETRSASEVSLKHFYPLLAPSGALVFYHGLVIDPQQQPTCQPLIITYKKNQGN